MTTFIVVESITPQVSVQFSADQGPQGGQGVAITSLSNFNIFIIVSNLKSISESINNICV